MAQTVEPVEGTPVKPKRSEIQYSKWVLYSHIALASSAVFSLTTVIFNIVELYQKQRWFIINPIGPDMNCLEKTSSPNAEGYDLCDQLSSTDKITVLNLTTLILVSISAGALALLVGFIYYDKLIEKLFKVCLWINFAFLLATLGVASALQYYYNSSSTTYTFKTHEPVVGKISQPRFLSSNNIFLIVFSINGILSTVFLIYKLMKAPRIHLVD